MADVRSLLRQQRAARRITHPHAAYSDGGKLLCTLCRESVKAEALWEGHLRTSSHRERLAALSSDTTAPAESHKRKLPTDDDTDGADDDAVRRKRSRAHLGAGMAIDTSGGGVPRGLREGEGDSGKGAGRGQTLTPPLNRRTSGTRVQGGEIKMPSRPATPNPLRDGSSASAVSTPLMAPLGRSPLIPTEATMPPLAAASDSLAPALPPVPVAVDEAAWAAFEAQVINAPAIAAPAPEAAGYAADAVISAAPVSAEEAEEAAEREKRRALADVQMADEAEDATRALEVEFEEMEELEARVRRLKEKREALRRPSLPVGIPVDPSAVPKGSASGKENSSAVVEEEEDDDDDDEDLDWDGFRFRA